MLARVENSAVAEVIEADNCFALEGKTPEEIHGLGYLPLEDAAFDLVNNMKGEPSFDIQSDKVIRSWAASPRDLSVFRAMKKDEVYASFELQRTLGFSTSLGIKMDADRADIDNLSRLAQYAAAQNLSEVMVRDFSNTYHTITIAQLNAMIIDLVGNGLALFQRKWELEATIDAATTVAAIQAVTW